MKPYMYLQTKINYSVFNKHSRKSDYNILGNNNAVSPECYIIL